MLFQPGPQGEICFCFLMRLVGRWVCSRNTPLDTESRVTEPCGLKRMRMHEGGAQQSRACTHKIYWLVLSANVRYWG
jgi:hypothetical protein